MNNDSVDAQRTRSRRCGTFVAVALALSATTLIPLWWVAYVRSNKIQHGREVLRAIFDIGAFPHDHSVAEVEPLLQVGSEDGRILIMASYVDACCQLLSEYHDAVRQHGVDSPEAQTARAQALEGAVEDAVLLCVFRSMELQWDEGDDLWVETYLKTRGSAYGGPAEVERELRKLGAPYAVFVSAVRRHRLHQRVIGVQFRSWFQAHGVHDASALPWDKFWAALCDLRKDDTYWAWFKSVMDHTPHRTFTYGLPALPEGDTSAVASRT